jgi:CopG family nickel-responsive transcriptional regulator
MGKLARFGVSLDSSLLDRFDRLIAGKGYANRSEALRDLIREALIAENWREGKGEAVAVVTLVYDHHDYALPKRLTDAQHETHDIVISTLHVHLSHESCLEVLILRGAAGRLRAFADSLVGTRGVKHGKVIFTTTGDGLT